MGTSVDRQRTAESKSVLLRQAGPADILAVCAIARLAREAAQWSEAAVESFACTGGEILLAMSNEVIAGFLASRRAADEIAIVNLGVLPEFRRRGLGRRLVEAALLGARERGAKSAHLEVRRSNQQAIAFYGVCGFRVGGTRKGYYHDPVEDAVLMDRKVGSP